MSNFYVCKREHYAVFEPAEGGYYADASTVTICERFYHLEEAVSYFNELVEEGIENGDELEGRGDFAGFKEIDPGCTVLVLPYAYFRFGPYVGDNYEIEITTEKEEDAPYEGYR